MDTNDKPAVGSNDELGAWVSTADRLPEEGQSVAFVVRAFNRLDYLNGKVLGGYFRAGPFYGFGVPGLIVDAWYWMPMPPAPQVPDAPQDSNAKSTGQVGTA